MSQRRVLVCGSRSYSDTQAIESRLEALKAECEAAGGVLVVVHGDCPTGADAIAHRWAKRTDGVWVDPVPADWNGLCRRTCKPGHRRTRLGGSTYCPAAGNYRNQRAIAEHGPFALALAWVDKPLARCRGTADMVRRAIDAGIPYELVEPEPVVPMARLWEGP